MDIAVVLPPTDDTEEEAASPWPLQARENPRVVAAVSAAGLNAAAALREYGFSSILLWMNGRHTYVVEVNREKLICRFSRPLCYAVAHDTLPLTA